MHVLPRTGELPRYHHIDETQERLSSDADKGWKVLFLFMRGSPVQPNEAICPKTIELIRSLPNAMGAFFSVLEPGKSISTHCGPDLANLRYHTALIVPENRPPTMRVKDSYHTWKERTSLLFDDSLPHSVQNDSDGIRVVLIVEVWRPLPWFLDALNRFVGWCWRTGTSHEQWLEVVHSRTLVPAGERQAS
jgi:aspartyl/asparaginyl beta-hydroxylase (cupin superfamily)